MKLITAAIRKQLLKNAATKDKTANKPCLKLFGGESCTWLISEMREEAGDIYLFGLCDLGMGSPELGEVSFNEISKVRFLPFGLPVERDMWFTPGKTLTEYAAEARDKGRIIA